MKQINENEKLVQEWEEEALFELDSVEGKSLIISAAFDIATHFNDSDDEMDQILLDLAKYFPKAIAPLLVLSAE